MKRTGCWLVLLAVVPVVHQKMPCDTLIADARAPSEPNGILISVRAPVEAVVSEPFTIDIQISNRRSDDDYVLEDIDIEDTYFEGFEVVRMKPIPEEFDRSPKE